MKWKLFAVTTLALALAVSCNSKNDDTTEDIDSSAFIMTEAVSEASAHATSTEGGSATVASARYADSQLDILEEEIQFAKTQMLAGTTHERVNQFGGECRYSSVRTCSATSGTVAWNSCTISGPRIAVTMTGGWSETWTNGGDCARGYVSSGDSVSRASTGSTMSFPGGGNITTDTKGGTAYDGTVFASGAVITNRVNTTNRSIAMTPTNSAIHKVYSGRRGATIFDYYVQPAITVTGTKTNGMVNGMGSTSANRAMSGTVTLYHNLAKYTAVNTFNSVTWSTATCCFPVSGNISTTFTGTGAPAGPYVLTFLSTCGYATLTTPADPNGTQVELSSCQ